MNSFIQIGLLLREKRIEKNLSIQKAAKGSKIAAKTIYNIENSDCGNVRNLIKYSNFLGLKIFDV